ncbi:hypothetical protein B0H21DRAFT_688862 [Amylocystis lapponica]|nr:hypothetical protein B0H21DRAFT_688862 [Amylocystis lapponica]
MRRLEPAGLHPFPVTLAPGIRDRTVSRPALSQHFGGNLRSSFPAIPAGKLAEHGYDNFMCINLLYAPHAPQNPGHPGLFLQLTPARGSWAQQRPDCHWDTMVVFVRLKAGAWLYLGEYEMTPVASLTPGEWRAQSDAVRRNWSENTAAKGWARYIRAKIHLRRRLGRDPTEEEIDAGMEDKQQYDDVTAEDVVEAYDTGAEAMGAWCMKCVGYDEDFQRLVGSLEQSKRPLKTTRKTARKGTRT